MNKAVFRVPWRFQLKRWVMRLPPLIVWGAAVIGASQLYMRQERALTITGFAREIRYHVSSETGGRIKRLDVEPHQEVRSGQIVALLDDSALLLQLQEARLELERLGYEINRESALWDQRLFEAETGQQADLRRLARDIESAHIDYLRRLAQLSEDRIRLQGLELNLKRSMELHKTELIPSSRVDDDRIAYEALEKNIAMQEPYIEEMKKSYEESQARATLYREEYIQFDETRAHLLKPFEYSVRIQEVRIEQINLDVSRLALRSPADGVVVDVLIHSGEVVDQGQPIVSILEPASRELVAYIPEERILAIEPSFKVHIRRKADPAVLIRSRISHVGDHIEPLPQRMTSDLNIQSFGLAVYIPVPESLNIKPGEAFEIIPQYVIN